jgi:hypothetical protein
METEPWFFSQIKTNRKSVLDYLNLQALGVDEYQKTIASNEEIERNGKDLKNCLIFIVMFNKKTSLIFNDVFNFYFGLKLTFYY